jgi:tryptophan synthase alpha chain
VSERYRIRFESLARRREGAFVPFTVLGDPDPETSLAILRAFVAGGADMLELGIPFSDPVADGPTIQGADLRALGAGVNPASALSLIAEFRRVEPDIPIGLLLYANLIHRAGPEAFYGKAAVAGVDSILVADLPIEESAPFRRAARSAGIGAVSMVTPMTSDARLRRLTAEPAPYLYVVSRTGVTGRDESLAASAGKLLGRIGRQSRIPTLLGFGIGKPAQVGEAIAAGASGAISGSAAVEIIASFANRDGKPLARAKRAALAAEITRFTAGMKRATRPR